MRCINLILIFSCTFIFAMEKEHRKILEAARQFDTQDYIESLAQRSSATPTTIYQSIEAKSILLAISHLFCDKSNLFSFLPDDLKNELTYFIAGKKTSQKITHFIEENRKLVIDVHQKLFLHAFSSLKQQFDFKLGSFGNRCQEMELLTVIVTKANNEIFNIHHLLYFEKQKEIEASGPKNTSLLLVINRGSYRSFYHNSILDLIRKKFPSITNDSQVIEMSWSHPGVSSYSFN